MIKQFETGNVNIEELKTPKEIKEETDRLIHLLGIYKKLIDDDNKSLEDAKKNGEEVGRKTLFLG
jgi:hypothetical protein